MGVNIGWPGKIHDARVFAYSSLYNKCMKGTFVPKWPKIIGVEVPLPGVYTEKILGVFQWLKKSQSRGSGGHSPQML